jgi:hypothetical protein
MFSHVKGPAAGQPFKLEPWQRRFVSEFSRTNGGGERIYKRGMLGVARGNGKSPLAAGLALRELVCTDDEPDVILAAAARDQARVVFEYARGFVESGPLLDLLQVGRHEIRNPANGGVLRTVSADGFVAHGRPHDLPSRGWQDCRGVPELGLLRNAATGRRHAGSRSSLVRRGPPIGRPPYTGPRRVCR